MCCTAGTPAGGGRANIPVGGGQAGTPAGAALRRYSYQAQGGTAQNMLVLPAWEKENAEAEGGASGRQGIFTKNSEPQLNLAPYGMRCLYRVQWCIWGLDVCCLTTTGEIGYINTAVI